MPLGVPIGNVNLYVNLPYIDADENIDVRLTLIIDMGILEDTEQTIKMFKWVSELYKNEGYTMNLNRDGVYIDNIFADDFGTKQKLEKLFKHTYELQKGMK